MPKEMLTVQLDHVHLHVDNIDLFQELFEKIFSAKMINRTVVGTKEIVRLDLGGSHILLTPTNEDRPAGINHLGITACELDRVGEGLTESGWKLVETQLDDELRKQFFQSPEGILVELMEKING
jgi:catechol 2,3-dioxygenase-like lactoylglutathione lyase family enzyme